MWGLCVGVSTSRLETEVSKMILLLSLQGFGLRVLWGFTPTKIILTLGPSHSSRTPQQHPCRLDRTCCARDSRWHRAWKTPSSRTHPAQGTQP